MPQLPLRRETNEPHDRRSDQTNGKVQVVYFIAVTTPGTDEPVIRIGQTKDHVKRFKDHAKSKHNVTFNVTPLCMVRATTADEGQLHDYFAAHKIPQTDDRETFHSHKDIVDYVRWLRDQYFVWVPDCDQCPEDVGELPLVDSSLWMPNSERRKPAPAQVNLFSDFGPLNLPPREITIDDFYTSEAIIKAARAAMGGLDLDPASHAVANTVVQAKRFYTVHDDGLRQNWKGRVWLNPPFSQWEKWVPKIIGEWQSHRVEAMCVLCATRTLTAQYFAPIHQHSAALCIFRGRIKFWGGRAGAPDEGHVVFYFGNDVERFTAAFADIGFVTRR